MFDFFAQLLYPKKCVKCRRSGDYICDRCFAGITFLEYQLCGVCQKGSIDGLTHPKCRSKFSIDGIMSAISYKGIVKKLLYQFKYPPYLSDLKVILGRLFYEAIVQQEAFEQYISDSKNTFIVPVPLHASRLRKRGYNQAELLGHELSNRTSLRLLKVIERSKQTVPQFDLKREERAKNIVGAFEVAEKYKKVVGGANIILVDDITTTGATLRECAKVLKKSGAGKILGVTLAHEA